MEIKINWLDEVDLHVNILSLNGIAVDTDEFYPPPSNLVELFARAALIFKDV